MTYLTINHALFCKISGQLSQKILSSFNHGLVLIALLLLISQSLSAHAASVSIDNTLAAQLAITTVKPNKVNLTVSPEKCVAMQQGQNCYVTVELHWQAERTDNYCLYSSLKQQPLRCWNNSKNGEMTKEFTTNKNLRFYVNIQHANAQNNQASLASATVKMAWVHKKKGKPRMSWRLF